MRLSGVAEPLRPYLIPIEFDGASSAVRSNVESKRQALSHLHNGGALVIFPAGRVSTSEKLFGKATDAPWKLFAGKLIAQTEATVVPIFFEGQNRFLFHLVSRFSEALREALLMSEVARRIGDNVQATYRHTCPVFRAFFRKRPPRVARSSARYGLRARPDEQAGRSR